jgi:CBS domain-containing protein
MSLVARGVLVRDLMTDDLVTCSLDADLASVASILTLHRVHAVFVVGEDERPMGVLSDFDMLSAEWLGDDAEGLSTMKAITAREIMTAPVESIEAGATAGTAASRMRELHLSRLLVTGEEGRAVGVISVSDLVAPLGRRPVGRRTVRDVMSYAIVTCPPETPLAAAARAMTERRSRSVVVVDRAGRAVGVLTGNDLLSLYDSGDANAAVADLMRSPITCDVDLPLREAIDVIIRNEVHRVIVSDSSLAESAPVGVLSTSDVIQEMAQEGSVWQTE